MDTIKINKKNVSMIAHRGLASLEPENTLSAFVAAGNRSYFGIECDVHPTKDGKFVVIHDAMTGRVAKENINVEESTFEEVRKIILDNMSREEKRILPEDTHIQNRGDLIIPEMSEYINVCKKYNKKCVLEIKGGWTVENIEKMIDEISSLNYLENVIFISFSLQNLIAVRKRLPWQKIQYLVSEFNEEVLEKLNKYNMDLDIAHTGLTKEIVEKVHKNKHIVNCWTVLDKETAEKYVGMGVDQITTENLE